MKTTPFVFFMLMFSRSAINAQQPNIVLIMADDMGYETLGCNGSTEYRTPNLDRLANEGIRFTNCFSQSLCTPSRVKIMTGKYNFRNYEDFGYLNPKEKTFGNLLKEAGYATCIAGKWQLNGLNRNNPGNQDVTRPNHFGFDEYCLWQLNRTRAEGERYAHPLITQNGKDLPRNEEGYGPQVVSDFLQGFIDRNPEKPFFIYYPMILPHDPFVPTPDSPEWADKSRRYENDTVYFAGMVAYVDKIIGQLEAKLKEKGVWENTLFIFTADNGTNTSVLSNTVHGVVKGGKGSTLNTGNHVPMIISWPEKIKKSRVFDGVVDFTDILPTLADVAGIDPKAWYTDGKSLMGVLTGDKSRKDKSEIFIHYTPRWGKLDHDRWVTDGEYKLYRDGRFHNTLKDPLEKQQISVAEGEAKKIKAKFEAILKEKEDEFPFEWNDARYKPEKDGLPVE
jgi:arylsulfatase A